MRSLVLRMVLLLLLAPLGFWSASAQVCTTDPTPVNIASESNIPADIRAQYDRELSIAGGPEATEKPTIRKTTCRPDTANNPNDTRAPWVIYDVIPAGGTTAPEQLKSPFDTGACTISQSDGASELSCKGALGALGSISATSELNIGPCELFEQAIVQKDSSTSGTSFENFRKAYAGYVCAELVEALPSTFFSTREDTICIEKRVAGLSGGAGTLSTNTYRILDPTKVTGGAYCSAILTKSGQGIGALFGLVTLLYDLSLPILVALAVMSLVALGIMVMYAPGGGEDVLKQAKETAIRVTLGLLLLLFMRVFLTLISFDLFGEPEPSAPAAVTHVRSPNA